MSAPSTSLMARTVPSAPVRRTARMGAATSAEAAGPQGALVVEEEEDEEGEEEEEEKKARWRKVR